jgi:predicted DCC family thiol-disulfide oxidoreductase YuxK
VERLKAWDRQNRLSFLPAQDRAVPIRFPGISREELKKSIHVVDSEGRVWMGARAVEELVRILPGWRWAGWLFRLPLARPLAEAVYRLVARNRYRLSCHEHCGPDPSE